MPSNTKVHRTAKRLTKLKPEEEVQMAYQLLLMKAQVACDLLRQAPASVLNSADSGMWRKYGTDCGVAAEALFDQLCVK